MHETVSFFFPSERRTPCLTTSMQSPLCDIPVYVEPKVVVVAMGYAIVFGACSYLLPRLSNLGD